MSANRRPSAAMVVAMIALVVALTGTATAGPLAKLIGGSSIKPHSIPANRLVNHSITATQINLRRLGVVPHARLADEAALLGGARASAFLPASTLVRWNFSMNKGSASHTFKVGPITFVASCSADTTNTLGVLAVTTSESGTFVSTSPDSLPGTGVTINAGDMPYTVLEQDTATANDGNSTALALFDPAGKVALFSTAQTLGVAINTTGADCRFFGHLINDA